MSTAGQYDYLLHMKFSDAEHLLRTKGISLRRYNPDSLVTSDFKADRMNVETDTDDRIIKVIGMG